MKELYAFFNPKRNEYVMFWEAGVETEYGDQTTLEYGYSEKRVVIEESLEDAQKTLESFKAGFRNYCSIEIDSNVVEDAKSGEIKIVKLTPTFA